MEALEPGVKTCPIAFDHESERHARGWEGEFQAMRARHPIAWSSEHGGYWVATRYKDIVSIAQDSETFGSSKTFDPVAGVATGGVMVPPRAIPRGLPVECDRPEWDVYRGFINRKFAPKAAEARRADIRGYAILLIDRVIESGKMDFVHDFAGPLPAMATMDLLGLPLDEWRQFAEPLHELVYTSSESPEYGRIIAGMDWIFSRCIEEFRRYRDQPPQDNLLSHFAHEQISGRPVREEEMISYCMNILPGGVDTTTSLTANVLVYLHDHPSDRQRLIDDPSLLPIAREEFIRYFTPMHGAGRNVRHDVDFNQTAMKTGEQIYLAWAAGNRDPEIFQQPDTIDIARFPNRHIAFGAGMHRCVGSFLARVMFEEMIKLVLERVPDYALELDRAEPYPSIGTINGWINMPASFAPRASSATKQI